MLSKLNNSLSSHNGSRFNRRADPESLPELIDAPCDLETLRSCLRELSYVNRFSLSYRPIFNFLAHIAVRRPGRPIHIVDVGSGGGIHLVGDPSADAAEVSLAKLKAWQQEIDELMIEWLMPD